MYLTRNSYTSIEMTNAGAIYVDLTCIILLSSLKGKDDVNNTCLYNTRVTKTMIGSISYNNMCLE